MPTGVLNNCKITKHNNAAAAGTSVITPSAGIDMAGYENCLFLASFGTITTGAVTSIEVHGSDDDGAVDTYTALLGTNVVVADDKDNKIVTVEVLKPTCRYLKCIVNRATQNAVLDGIIAIQTAPRSLPVTASSTTVGNEVHGSPAEGAA